VAAPVVVVLVAAQQRAAERLVSAVEAAAGNLS